MSTIDSGHLGELYGGQEGSEVSDVSAYVSGDLAKWLQDKGMKHSRGAPHFVRQTIKNIPIIGGLLR